MLEIFIAGVCCIRSGEKSNNGEEEEEWKEGVEIRMMIECYVGYAVSFG